MKDQAPGKPHPTELRSHVVAVVEEGNSHREAARHFRVSPRCVNNLVKLKAQAAYLLVGKQNVVRIDPPESENPIGLHDVERAIVELPRLARSHAEATGHYVNQMFLGDAADRFVKCPLS